jgi:Glycosyltransferase family 87
VNGSLVGVRIRTREETLRGPVLPLRSLLWAWSSAVALALASASVWSVRHGAGDWRVFASAGSLAGTRALLAPPEAWQAFFYLPGASWALVPFARMPLAVSFALDALCMLACAALAGVVAARTFDRRAHDTFTLRIADRRAQDAFTLRIVDRCAPDAVVSRLSRRGMSVTIASVTGWSVKDTVATFVLWPPVVYAAAIAGQNAPLGLLLAQLAIAGVAARSVVLTAVPIGLLLYKPTYALPFVVLLLMRRRVRELAIVAGIGVAWYAASVAATGGDWAWPLAWTRLIARFAAGDFAVNAPFAVSLPGVLIRLGATPGLVVAVVALVAVACAVALRRVGAVEAACAACLAGLALSPHAWAYDAVLALPMIAYTASRLDERARTRLLLALSLIAPLFFVSPLLGFDPLAVVVIGGTFAWLAVRLLRPPAALGVPVSER